MQTIFSSKNNMTIIIIIIYNMNKKYCKFNFAFTKYLEIGKREVSVLVWSILLAS